MNKDQRSGLSVNANNQNHVLRKSKRMGQRLKQPLRIAVQTWPDGIDPVVSICCITYNHENFIRECLDGFLMQETTFPVEVLIHDDASTDGTADIIREYEARYPHIIKSIYQTENQYSKGLKINISFNLPRARGKYIALCEGDDYWTKSEKLQIQSNFMDQHPNCSICFHPAEICIYNNTEFKGSTTQFYTETGFFDKSKLFYEGGSSAPTASLLFRKSHFSALPSWLNSSPVGDMPLKLILSYRGDVGFINRIMSVRRLGTPGSWNVRTRGNKQRETNYLNGMIKMLHSFNSFSGYAWNKEVLEKIFLYETQKNILGADPWCDLSKKYPDIYRWLNWKAKLRINLQKYYFRLSRKYRILENDKILKILTS